MPAGYQKQVDASNVLHGRSEAILDRQEALHRQSLTVLDRQEELLRRAELLVERLEKTQKFRLIHRKTDHALSVIHNWCGQTGAGRCRKLERVIQK